MGIDSLSCYQARIDTWVQKVGSNVLIFAWQGSPSIALMKYVQDRYSQHRCYWLVFCDHATLVLEQAFFDTYPHLENIQQLLNPIGTSIFKLNTRGYLWLNQFVDYERFLSDFEYDLSLICYLNLPNIRTRAIVPTKPWYRMQGLQGEIKKTVVVGSGIVGAMTAYFLAENGVKVMVVDRASQVASAASGHYQGIMYAKVSAAETLQTKLLYKAYGLSLTLLALMDKKRTFSESCGVLHLDYNDREKSRNQSLAQKKYSLFRYLTAQESHQIAGIELSVGGLFWPHGAWVRPRLWVQKILQHPNITFRAHFDVQHLTYRDDKWQLRANNHSIEADALVLALGDDMHEIYRQLGLNFYFISGQTSVSFANDYSRQLQIILSGRNYISPAYDHLHCHGATFHPNNKDCRWDRWDDDMNLQNLELLSPKLYRSFMNTSETRGGIRGHRAVRCDSFDHLPTAGALGEAVQMKQIYAKLALDKNYRIPTECPYWPNLYVNTAHSSRGLLTASLCALAVVAEMLSLPNPFGLKLRQALSPNRLIINDIIKRKIS